MSKVSTQDMETEFEAKFLNSDKDVMRAKLLEAGALLVRPEFIQRRVTLGLPGEEGAGHTWLRVRDEGDKITMSIKSMTEDSGISRQKELTLIVDNFDTAVNLLYLLGCKKQGYWETRRELWHYRDTEITIDEWPFLEPFIEIEGRSEEAVRAASEELGFDYALALFCAVGHVYFLKYGVKLDEVYATIRDITFEMENPFLKSK